MNKDTLYSMGVVDTSGGATIDGYLKSANSIVNSSNMKLNADATFTMYYGSMDACGDVPNRLDVTEGWNFLTRVYRPGPSVLDGTYKPPKSVAVK